MLPSRTELLNQQESPLYTALKNQNIKAVLKLLKTGALVFPLQKPVGLEKFLKTFIKQTYLEGSDYPNDYWINVCKAFRPSTLSDSKEQKNDAMDLTPDAPIKMDITDDIPSHGANQKGSALFNAVKNNDVAKMKSLLQRGAKLFPRLKDMPVEKYLTEFLNQTDEKELAAKNFSYLTLCAHFKDNENLPLVCYCIMQDKLPELSLLLASGIEPNLKFNMDEDDFDLIHNYTSDEYREDCIIMGDEPPTSWKGATLLHIAAFSNNESMVTELVQRGAKITLASDGENRLSPWDFAEMFDNKKISENILIKLVEVGDCLTSKLNLPYFFVATQRNHVRLLRLLLNTNEINKMVSRWPNDEENIRAIFNPEDITGVDGVDRDFVLEAIVLGRYEILKECLLAEIDPNHTIVDSGLEKLPLEVAVKCNHIPITKLLLEHKADPNVGEALYEAAFQPTDAMLILFSEQKTDFNRASNKNGLTAAHFAALAGNKEGLLLLKKVGANLLMTDSSGRTIYDYFVLGGHYDMLQSMAYLCNEVKLTLPIPLDQVTLVSANEQRFLYNALVEVQNIHPSTSDIPILHSNLTTLAKAVYNRDTTELSRFIRGCLIILSMQSHEEHHSKVIQYRKLINPLFLRLPIHEIQMMTDHQLWFTDVVKSARNNENMLRLMLAWSTPIQREKIFSSYDKRPNSFSFQKLLDKNDITWYHEDAQLDYCLMHKLNTDHSTVLELKGKEIHNLVRSCKNLSSFKITPDCLALIGSFLRPDIEYKTKDAKTNVVSTATIRSCDIFKALEKQKLERCQPQHLREPIPMTHDLAPDSYKVRVFHVNERARFYYYLFTPKEQQKQPEGERPAKRFRSSLPDFNYISASFLQRK